MANHEPNSYPALVVDAVFAPLSVRMIIGSQSPISAAIDTLLDHARPALQVPALEQLKSD